MTRSHFSDPCEASEIAQLKASFSTAVTGVRKTFFFLNKGRKLKQSNMLQHFWFSSRSSFLLIQSLDLSINRSKCVITLVVLETKALGKQQHMNCVQVIVVIINNK